MMPRVRGMLRMMLLGPLTLCIIGLSNQANAQGGSPVTAGFGPPLGAHDGQRYGTHHVEEAGRVFEDTNFGTQNPDLQGLTCFGLGWEQLYHAGQDLYRLDGGSTAGAEVTAVADGVVIYANPSLNYPGAAVIVEHPQPSGQPLYSVYAHLDDNSVVVQAGEQVRRGQRLGTVMYQRYSGRFPARHPGGDDSHLHFELRQFADGRQIYANYPACDGLVVGRGYTYPQKPDVFPAPGAAYVDPAPVIGR